MTTIEPPRLIPDRYLNHGIATASALALISGVAWLLLMLRDSPAVWVAFAAVVAFAVIAGWLVTRAEGVRADRVSAGQGGAR